MLAGAAVALTHGLQQGAGVIGIEHQVAARAHALEPVARRQQARHALWERLYRLKQDGVTLLLTTHYMDEAEQLCDRLVVMDGGRIVAEGSPRALIQRHVTREVLELRYSPDVDLTVAATDLNGTGDRVEVLPDRLLVYVDDADAAHARIVDLDVDVAGVLTRRATLEDVFLALTGRTLVD